MRYVKVLATKRVNERWGYSLFEVEAYGAPADGSGLIGD